MGTVADKVNTELRSKFQTAVQLASTEQVEPLLDLHKYSRLKTVLRITAWVKRFIANARSSHKTQGELTSEELTAYICYICRRLKVKPAQQITAPLPRDRVTESPPL